MVPRLLMLLEEFKEEGTSIREDLDQQKEEIKGLYEDIEDAKARLLEVKVKITLARLKFGY